MRIKESRRDKGEHTPGQKLEKLMPEARWCRTICRRILPFIFISKFKLYLI